MKQVLSFSLEGVDWWVAHNVPGCARGFGPGYTLGVQLDGKLVVGVVFHNHNPENGVIEMSAAAIDKRGVTRKFIQTAHEFIFGQLGCQMALIRVSEDNKAMLRIGRALGYSEYRVPRLRGRNTAEIIMTLTDDNWRSSKWAVK